MIEAAKVELASHLDESANMVAGYNVVMPAGVDRERLEVQIRAAAGIVRRSRERSTIAGYGLRLFNFVSSAFALGAIGVYAEKCLDLLTKLLAG